MQTKTIKDYYEDIYKRFPGVDKKDIKKILNYGWKSLYLHNSYGGDVIVKDNSFWSYFGILTKDSLKHFNRYVLKLCIKIRVLYKRKKIPWDGFYYFALTDKQYQDYCSQINKRGRPKKYFKFEKVFLYKIFEECKVKEHSLKYILKISYPTDQLGYKYYKKELIAENPILVLTRDPLKFKDILVTNNDYDIL